MANFSDSESRILSLFEAGKRFFFQGKTGKLFFPESRLHPKVNPKQTFLLVVKTLIPTRNSWRIFPIEKLPMQAQNIPQKLAVS